VADAGYLAGGQRLLHCGSVEADAAQQRLDARQQLAHKASAARHYGQLGLQGIRAAGDMHFCLGHAFEALGHAELMAGDAAKMAECLAPAQEAAGRVPDAEARAALLADLANIW
jgi:hypothetical protein